MAWMGGTGPIYSSTSQLSGLHPGVYRVGDSLYSRTIKHRGHGGRGTGGATTYNTQWIGSIGSSSSSSSQSQRRSAPPPAPKPAPAPPPPYKPTHIDTSSSPPATKAPVYNINNDPAYKALQAKLASMKSQYSGLQGQYSGLQGQFSGLKGQYAAMNNNLQIISGQLQTSQEKEKAYAKAEQERIDQLAAQNAFGKTTNKQVGGVKTKKSLALQQGLTSRGTSGSFGRSGLRIKNLNI